MGINLKYNQFSCKWELSGYGFVWRFNTREEAESNKKNAWEYHKRKLEAQRMVAEMLSVYR